MAVDKTLEGLFTQDDFEMSPEGLTVVEEESVPEDSLVTELEDGSVEIDFDPTADEGMMDVEFDGNLAEVMEDDDLRTLAVDLVGKFDSDKNSRSDWEETYEQGLDQLGLEIEERTTPWSGACGVFHIYVCAC